MVGYNSTGGYKLYDPVLRTTCINRDVIVDEVGVWQWEATEQGASTIILEDVTAAVKTEKGRKDDSSRRSSRVT